MGGDRDVAGLDIVQSQSSGGIFKHISGHLAGSRTNLPNAFRPAFTCPEEEQQSSSNLAKVAEQDGHGQGQPVRVENLPF